MKTSHALGFSCWVAPLPSGISKRCSSLRVSFSGDSNSSSSTLSVSQDRKLLSLLQQRKTDEAWFLYAQCGHLPNAMCLSRLVAQLSHLNSGEGLTKAQSIIQRLQREQQLHLLDANSLGLLAVAAAKGGRLLYALSIMKSMLNSGYLPNVKAWSAVTSRLAASGDDGPVEAIKLFESMTRRVRLFKDVDAVKDSAPDTGAYNAVLNACANLGDVSKFSKLFDEMPDFDCVPDAWTYNVMIKLCARIGRKDLLVIVLEAIIHKGIDFCVTTLHSMVAAYVGLGDLETAERLVQAMRDGRRDICRILRESSDEEFRNTESSAFQKLLPNYSSDLSEPPELPRAFPPDSRIYTTLMKGYMQAGRVSETVRILEVMRCEDDSLSHPDHVAYTTVISAFVNEGSIDKARQVLTEMVTNSVPANVITYNVLLKGYCQKLQLELAEDLLREMIHKAGIQPDVVSYNTLIDGFIRADDSAGALTYFNEMRARGITPTKVSYTTLMKAFSASNQPKLAHKVFNEMCKDPRVKVDLVAWNMLLEGYCKLGLVEEAKNVIQAMKDHGVIPNVATYGSLASGISIARKPGEALILWKEIKGRCGFMTEESSSLPRITPDEGLLDTLADICVRAAFFRKALEIIACMEEHGIPPNKTKYKRIYVEMHSKMFTSKHASRARQDRRKERKRAAEAFKFWLGLPNSYYGGNEWQPHTGDVD